MGSTTAIHALHYPATGDPPAGPTQIEQLANDLDLALPVVTDTAPAAPVAGLVWYAPTAGTLQVWDGTAWQPIVQGAWTAYTPTLSNASTGAALASSGASGKYTLIGGKTCIAQGGITASATSSGGIAVSLPFTAHDRDLDCGTLGIFGGTPPAGQTGIAEMLGDQARLVPVNFTSGFMDISSGQTLRWSVTYELP